MKRKLLILAVIAVFGAAAAANFLLPPAENKTPSPAIPAENSGDTTVFAGEASPKENTEPAEEKENNAEKINHNSETAGENGSRNKEVKSARPERENNSSLSLPSRQGEAARQTEKVKEKNNQEETNNPAESPRVTYNTYTVQQGDTLWLIAQSSGIPMAELLAVNQISENTPLYPGMTLKIPQYNIPPKKTPGPGYGELLDWWTEAQYLWPIGQNARIIDFETGKSFNVRRSYGAFHAMRNRLQQPTAQ